MLFVMFDAIMKYKTVIFDFDGVLGKTMYDNYAAWTHVFELVGISMERVEYFLLEGMNPRKVAETILARNGRDMTMAPRLASLKEQYYCEHNSFVFYPRAQEIIAMLHGKYRLSLVTGAGSKRLAKTVSREFLSSFDVIITGDDVLNPKPDPEPYLIAMARLNAASAECVVIENAPLGISAVKNAGMDCIAICSTLDQSYLSQANVIVHDLQEAAAYLLGTGFKMP